MATCKGHVHGAGTCCRQMVLGGYMLLLDLMGLFWNSTKKKFVIAWISMYRKFYFFFLLYSLIFFLIKSVKSLLIRENYNTWNIFSKLSNRGKYTYECDMLWLIYNKNDICDKFKFEWLMLFQIYNKNKGKE